MKPKPLNIQQIVNAPPSPKSKWYKRLWAKWLFFKVRLAVLKNIIPDLIRRTIDRMKLKANIRLAGYKETTYAKLFKDFPPGKNCKTCYERGWLPGQDPKTGTKYFITCKCVKNKYEKKGLKFVVTAIE